MESMQFLKIQYGPAQSGIFRGLLLSFLFRSSRQRMKLSRLLQERMSFPILHVEFRSNLRFFAHLFDIMITETNFN